MNVADSAEASVSRTKRCRPRWAMTAQDFHRHGAECVVSADMSCLLHLKGVIDRLKLPLKVIHIAQVLNGGPL